jgi:hypothetical protein
MTATDWSDEQIDAADGPNYTEHAAAAKAILRLLAPLLTTPTS